MSSGREVVLVGGGHAHLTVLARAVVHPSTYRLSLITDEPVSVYSGMVPGFVAGQYRREELEVDLAPLARAAGVRLIIARAERIDTERREIALDNGRQIPYDIASFDIGASAAGLDLPGIAEHALPVRPIGVFVTEIENTVTRARSHSGPEPFRVVVVGGGAGGVELAFTLQRRIERDRGSPAEVLLLEAGPEILRRFPPALTQRVRCRAHDRGIEIRCGQQVIGAERYVVHLASGQHIPYDVLIWVSGPASHPLFSESGLPTDKRGFVRVRRTLEVDGCDTLFAAGDCATMIDYPETPKAGVYAVRQGPVIAHNLAAAATGDALQSYTPQQDFLTLLNLGDGTALGSKWGRTAEGRWVMRLKDYIDRRWINAVRRES